MNSKISLMTLFCSFAVVAGSTNGLVVGVTLLLLEDVSFNYYYYYYYYYYNYYNYYDYYYCYYCYYYYYYYYNYCWIDASWTYVN